MRVESGTVGKQTVEHGSLPPELERGQRDPVAAKPCLVAVPVFPRRLGDQDIVLVNVSAVASHQVHLNCIAFNHSEFPPKPKLSER